MHVVKPANEDENKQTAAQEQQPSAQEPLQEQQPTPEQTAAKQPSQQQPTTEQQPAEPVQPEQQPADTSGESAGYKPAPPVNAAPDGDEPLGYQPVLTAGDYYKEAMREVPEAKPSHTMEDIYREAERAPERRYQDMTAEERETLRSSDPKAFKRLRRRYRMEKAGMALSALGDLGAAVARYWGGVPAQQEPKAEDTLSGRYASLYHKQREQREAYNKGLAEARAKDRTQTTADQKERRQSVRDIIRNYQTLRSTEQNDVRLNLAAEKNRLQSDKNDAEINLLRAQAAYAEAKSDKEREEARHAAEAAAAEIAYNQSLVKLNEAKQKACAATVEADIMKAQAAVKTANDNALKARAALITAQANAAVAPAKKAYYEKKAKGTGSLLGDAPATPTKGKTIKWAK